MYAVGALALPHIMQFKGLTTIKMAEYSRILCSLTTINLAKYGQMAE